MKTRLAAVLSLTGVLVAGTAAALVNTQVLQSAGSSADEVLVTTESTVPDTAGATQPTVLPAETTAPAATQAAYQIGDAGVVVLDTAGDVLTVVSTKPSNGWLVAEVEQVDPLNIEVKFAAGSITVEFKANLLFGVVSTSVESKDSNAPASSSGSGSGGSVTTVDDHGGDDGDNSGPGSGDDGGGDDNSGPGSGDDDHSDDD